MNRNPEIRNPDTENAHIIERRSGVRRGADRRLLIGGLAGAGLTVALAGSASAATTGATSVLTASALKTGDLIIAPNGEIVRVVTRLIAVGGYTIGFTLPGDANKTGLITVKATDSFVVLARGTDVWAPTFQDVPRGIDGGTP